MTAPRRVLSFVSAVLATGLLTGGLYGCVNLKQIQDFAALSAESAGYEGLARDYVAAPDRRKQFEPPKFHAQLDALKAKREAQLADLQGLQSVITAYMSGLGDLASDETINFDKSTSDLAASLNQSKLLSDKDTQAATTISALLARAVTDGYRQRKLKTLITDSNQPLQDVIAATRKIVSQGFVNDLRTESALVSRYYANFMLAPDNPPEPVAMVLAQEAKVEALAQVDGRIRTAQDFDAVLVKIASGHQYLYENRNRIGTDELNRQVKPYVGRLKAAYKALVDTAQ